MQIIKNSTLLIRYYSFIKKIYKIYTLNIICRNNISATPGKPKIPTVNIVTKLRPICKPMIFPTILKASIPIVLTMQENTNLISNLIGPISILIIIIEITTKKVKANNVL